MSEQIQVSTVTSALDTVPRDYDARRVIETIRTGGKELRGRVELIRETSQRELAIHGDAKRAKVAAAELKKQLPAVLWSGTFTKRASDALVQHSGLLCADLDSLNGTLADVRGKLSQSPHLWALFTSPSGDGLKAVFRVYPDAAKHAGSFRSVEQHVKQLTGVQIDQACKDVTRLCFLSFDPGLIHNTEAREIGPLPEPEKPRPITNGMVDLSERQRIAGELLRDIDWQTETSGFIACPGKHLHTSGDNERDCELHLDNAPTLHCFHNSCRGILDGVNHELRSRIGRAEYKPDSVSSHTPTTGDHQSGNADDETIRLLAALSPLEYDRQRKTEAERLGCQLSTLDKLVEAKRPASNTSGLQGSAVLCPDVEPWPEPVDGAAVLNEAAERIASYVALPEGAADLLALWCTHSHCFQSFECSPRLNITSPERGCGKTTLRDVVALFVPRPLCLEKLTSAGAIRLAEQYAPVIMADEYDAWLKDNEELRGLLNAGHRKGGVVVRCQGDNNEPRLFRVYTPAVLCGIGALPGTLHDRSIVIRLERAKPGELSARFDSRRTGKEKELNRKLSRFCADNRERLQTIDPQLPEGVFNRMADNWRLLFAIAEVAGGDWLKRCAEALGKLIIKSDETETRRVQLLADIRQGLKETGVDRIFSRDLIEYLEALTQRPWGEVNRGKPINERWLARNLAAFGIHSKTLRIGTEQKKGYELADFGDAFARYLPTPGDSIRPTVPHEGKSDFPIRPNAEAGTDAKPPVYEGMGRWDACEGGVALEQKNDGLIEEAKRLFNAVPVGDPDGQCPEIEHAFQPQTNTKENNMQDETTKPQTRLPVDRESVRLLAIELGVREAARRCGLSEDRVRKWSSRYKWLEQKAPRQQKAAVTVVTTPGDVLIATHKQLEATTRTALMQTATKAAVNAAQKPPLDVSNTSQFRDLATSSSRIFGWNTKAAPQTQFNQVVISQEQLREIGMLRDKMTPEESEEVSRKLSEMTPQEMEEFGRKARELLARARNMEQPKHPPTPSAPEIYEVTIRGDGGGVKVRS